LEKQETEQVEPPLKFRDEVQKIHRKQKSPMEEGRDRSHENVQDPKRYEEKLSEYIAQQKLDSPKARVPCFSLIRERDDTRDARDFLYQQYNGECQVTGETFVKADGTNYFVAVALVPYQGTKYLNNAGNMLCLSANMAARFLYSAFDWIDDIGEKIEAFKPAEEGGTEQHRTIRIRITGEEHSIRFSEKHFFRLKALWAEA
jgi:hypothetical protein